MHRTERPSLACRVDARRIVVRDAASTDIPTDDDGEEGEERAEVRPPPDVKTSGYLICSR